MLCITVRTEDGEQEVVVSASADVEGSLRSHLHIKDAVPLSVQLDGEEVRGTFEDFGIEDAAQLSLHVDPALTVEECCKFFSFLHIVFADMNLH